MESSYIYKVFEFKIISDIYINRFSLSSTNKTLNTNNELFIKYTNNVFDNNLSNIIYQDKLIKISKDAFILKQNNIFFKYINEIKTLYVNFKENNIFEQYLTGPIIALIGAYKGYTPLHSSALRLKNKNILILGNSGAGKSTILYEFIKKYSAVYYSDDIVYTKNINNQIIAFSSFPEIKLWHDSVKKFDAKIINKVHYKVNKYFVKDDNKFLTATFIPDILFIIELFNITEPVVEEISGGEKMLKLFNCLYRQKWINTVFSEQTFITLSKLSNQTKVFNIKRPIYDKHMQKSLSEIIYQKL